MWRPPPCSSVRTTPLPSVQHIDYKSTDYRTALSLNSRRPLIQIHIPLKRRLKWHQLISFYIVILATFIICKYARILEIGAQRAPRLLVFDICTKEILFSWKLDCQITFYAALMGKLVLVVNINAGMHSLINITFSISFCHWHWIVCIFLSLIILQSLHGN